MSNGNWFTDDEMRSFLNCYSCNTFVDISLDSLELYGFPAVYEIGVLPDGVRMKLTVKIVEELVRLGYLEFSKDLGWDKRYMMTELGKSYRNQPYICGADRTKRDPLAEVI